MTKAILFDADGVLINGEMFSIQLARDYGISTEQTLPFFTGIFTDCIIGNADLKEVIQPYLKEWGWTKTVDDFLEYWFSSEHNIDEALIAYIQNLREQGIKCYVATNQEKHRVKYMLEHMGFADSFDGIFASAHLGHRKPDFQFYQKVVDQLGLEKEEILFWDDTVQNIEAAKEFGINAEFYTNFDSFKKTIQKYL